MPHAIVEAVASLRDSLIRLSQRSFDDFDAFNAVAKLQFRSNAVAKRVAQHLAGGDDPEPDATVVAATLNASGKVSVAEPIDPESIALAVGAARAALDRVEVWLDRAGEATVV